jgi:PKD domain
MNVPYVQMIMNGRRQAAQGHSLKRGVIRRGLTLGLAAGLWLALVPSTQAVADVTQPTWSKWYPVSFGERAQTFTAPSTGGLDHVSLMLNYDYGYGSGGTVDVRNVDATSQQPTGAALPGSVVDLHGATATYAYPFFKFPFASPIPVTGGKTYAIVMTITYGVRSWAGATSAVYDGGRAWMAPGCTSACTWSSTGYYPYDFAFEAGLPTAPAPGANSAPTVKANVNPTTVPEGTIPTNTGTFSDPDGDTVTLSASANTGSAGTVTATGAGTWSWSGAAADEGQGQTITITADDLHGNKATTQFSTVVENAPPKATISGAPASAREGTTITLTASATSPSAEDTAAPFIFMWSGTDYNSKLPDGSGSTYPVKIDDEGVYKITLIAIDDGGVPSPAVTVTINGVDSTPAAAITSVSQSFVIVPQQTLTFNGTYTDAGSAVDPSTLYTATWAWGDKSPNTSGFTTTHSYSAAGTYTATLTVADDDGVSGSATTTVTVLTPEAALAKLTSFAQGVSGLNAGQKNSLLAKLNAAADSLQRGNSNAACGQLNAFANEVDADQKAGHLTSGDAGTMASSARQIQMSLGCFHTLVEFLNGL